MLNYKRPTGHRVIESFIDPSATLGEGSVAWWYSIILGQVRIGANCSIGSRAEIGRGSIIGDGTRIGSGAFLPPNSTIGARVFIGPNVTFTDDKHPKVPDADDPPYRAQPPLVEDDAAIGAGAIILPGIRIGRGARVAAGAVVTEDVPAFTVVKGLPARVHASKHSGHDWIDIEGGA